MPLDLSVVGTATEPREVRWDSNEALLYALGVGAGQDDPLSELAFTTENSHGVAQRVLPSFGVILAQFRVPARLSLGTFDPAMLVHAEQSLELSSALPAEGIVEVSTAVEGIYDKGSGALVVTIAEARVPGASDPLIVTRSSLFIRGEGGFGIAGPKDDWEAPEREPDVVVDARTRTDQALLYRLSGDHNPLHSDPAFAARARFPRPILHGMCTYGVVARVLLNELAEGDPERFRSMNGRFSKPVFPGDGIHVRVWQNGDENQFQVVDDGGDVVLDRGAFALR